MLSPRCKITFTKADNSAVTFTFLQGFETNEGYRHMTDTCSIILPRKYQTMQGEDLFAGSNPVFKRGDKVKIEAGYFPNSTVVFEGFIRAVRANLPLLIECEDGMYQLKKYTFNIPAKVPLITKTKKGKFLKRPKIDWTKVKDLYVKDLLDTIIPDDIDYVLLDNVNLGKLRAINATAAMILEQVRERVGLFSYFVGTTLYVGFAQNAARTSEATIKMEENVINANDLFYKQADEINIKVRATSMNDKNVKFSKTVGDDDGEQRDYHYYNYTEAQLEEAAKKRLAEEKYTGYFGTLETFGEPTLKHGDRLNIVSVKLPERNGTYLIRSVRRIMDVNKGYRQYFELGVKVG